MEDNFFKYLISPETEISLEHKDGRLITENGREIFPIYDDIAYLLKQDNLNRTRKHEIDVFDHLHIKNVSYFRDNLFQDVMNKIDSIFKKNYKSYQDDFIVAEMGGGEGHWARYIKRKIPGAMVFICDLSMKALGRAPDELKKICADITRPIFKQKTVSLLSFWVSLHHLDNEDIKNVLTEAVKCLKDEGILLIFEPNIRFFPRKIMYKIKLNRDVYFDEKEKALNFSEITKILEDIGLSKVGIYFINPPYNPDFVTKLKRWFIYITGVEFLYRIDRWILGPLFGDIFSKKQSRLKEYLSLYGLAIYKKA